ncbi:MAG: nitroreductase family protein [Deltaproteobacteria bacterium]|nr:MAG: nitroreductase family protein [Deltaproteobacteria bacterium]
MEFKELVKARRSCRSFDTSALTDDQLNAILEAGQWAPSPLNLQPWQFIIVTDPEIKAGIKAIAEEARQGVVDQGGPGWVNKYPMDFIAEAPVLIVVVVDPAKGGLGTFFGQQYGALSASCACVQNMMLAAADMGLGSLWLTFFDPEKLRDLLDIPANLEVTGVLPIGKPKGEMEAPPRKPPKVHQQRFTKSN